MNIFRFYAMHFCYFACMCTRHRGGCAIINEGGALYPLLSWATNCAASEVTWR